MFWIILCLIMGLLHDYCINMRVFYGLDVWIIMRVEKMYG
jgi:hypothetical protein